MTPSDPAETAKIVSVANGLFVRQAIDNMAWIDLGEYAVVVDALEQRELADEIFAAIRSSLGEKQVRYLLNTHTDHDHMALNAAFERRFGTEIVNQRSGRIPAEGRWFEGPLRRVLMLPMPGCHSDGDCVIWVPDARALFVGDIFGWGLIPTGSDVRTETVQRLEDTYGRLVDFAADVVIPGHGPLCTTAELKRWAEYLIWLRDEISRACSEGRTDRKIKRAITAPEDMRTWWRFTLWKHEDSVSKVLNAIRSGQLS